MKTINKRVGTKGILFAFFLVVATMSGFSQQRIVLGGKAVIMVADAVYLFPGAGDHVIAVAGADQGLGVFLTALDPAFPGKPVIDRNAGVEVYASLKPDAVIMKSSMRKSVGASLDALGIRQLYLNLETPEDYAADIAALGEFLGEKARAAEIAAFYERALSDVAARLAPRTGANGASQNQAPGAKPKVLLVQAASPAEGVWEVPPASWMQTRLVELAGGVPVWKGANPGAGWAKVNAEQIAAWNPDAIFVVNYRENARKAARSLAADGRLSRVEAVRRGTVYGFAQDFYSWDQPDTRWILGLQWMAAMLHPPLFADKPILAEARIFFSTLYGMDSAAFDSTVGPRLADDMAP